MRVYRVTIFISIVLFFLQTGLFANFSVKSALPNLILILVTWLALRSNVENLLLAAVIGGFLVDTYSVMPFGVNMFIFILCGLTIYYSTNQFFKKGDSDQFFVFMLFSYFIFYLYVYVFLFAISFLSHRSGLTLGTIFNWVFVIGFAYTFILSVLLFYLLERIPVYASPQKGYLQSKY